MYGDIEARAQEFASWVGIHKYIAMIFVKRIPLKIKKMHNGKEKIIDGDTVIYTCLDGIAAKKSILSIDRAQREFLRNQYHQMIEEIKKDPAAKHSAHSMERYFVESVIGPTMPRAKKITIDELSNSEVTSLYEWIAF